MQRFSNQFVGIFGSPADIHSPPGSPPPNTPPGIQAVNHIVFLLQENRSFDSYFGSLGAYRAANNFGAITDIDGLPANSSNSTDIGQPVPSYHFQTSCVENVTPDWLESHGDFNKNDPGSNMFLDDGFVHTGAGMAKFSGEVFDISHNSADTLPSSGQLVINTSKETMNYYIFANGDGTALASVFVPGLPGGNPVTKHPSPANIPPVAGTMFSAASDVPQVGQTTLTWSVPSAIDNTVLINSWFDQLGRRSWNARLFLYQLR